MTCPCEVGFACPFEAWDEYCYRFCAYPDLTLDERLGKEYPPVECGMWCPHVKDGSPLEAYLDGYEEVNG